MLRNSCQRKTMKLAFMLALVIGSIELCNADSGRLVLNMNPDWKFTKGDSAGAQATTYKDASWNSVGLPHSASIPYFLEQSCYSGWAWYRKHFTASPQWNGNRVFVDFEAVFQHCWVYVNGSLVGEHKGGYTGFSYDITQNINFSGDNVIAVRLNNLWDARIAPRAGDHNFHAGIYRDVRLVICNPLHVTRYGTFVTTPNASDTKTGVRIKTEIKNDATVDKVCVLKSIILDSSNNVITSVSSTYTIPAGGTYTFSQDTAISNPKLWSPDDPFLYSLHTEVYDGTALVDTTMTEFGVRWFTVSNTNGFFLNGKHLYLRGFDVHQDRAGWADAVTNSGFYRDMKMLKDCGTNCIRASHYPKDPAYYRACDKLGILVFAELHFWGRGGLAGGKDGDYYAEAYPIVDADRPEFEANLTSNLKDMIREARNHPSIFAYSLGNETDMQMTGTVLDNCKAFWKTLNKTAHQEDSTRLTSCGWVSFTFQNLTADQSKEYVDLVGFNGGNPTAQCPYPALTTEYGSCVVNDRPGTYGGCGEVPQDQWRCGALRWCAFHHGTHIDGQWGSLWSHMGMVDYNRIPLRQYYWYRNQWTGAAPPTWPSSGTPAKLQITTDKTSIFNDGTDDCMLTITVIDANNKLISNNLNAKLTITGPGLLPTGTTWDFSTPDGQQGIDMRTYGTGSITVTASTTTAGVQNGTITITAKDAATAIRNPRNGQTNQIDSRSNFKLTSNFIRPTVQSIRISYLVPKTGRCSLKLYDIMGHVIHTISDSYEEAGDHAIVWDGKDNLGRPVANGSYILTFQSSETKKNEWIHVLK